MKQLIAEEYKRFENIKQIREDGSEFWSARELAIITPNGEILLA